MNRLPLDKQCQVIHLLVEGNSLRSTSRISDVSYNTVLKILVKVGYACLRFHSQTAVNLICKRIQCDEQWSFVYCKQKNKDSKKNTEKFGGDVWTWLAFDPDTKFTISWYVGLRDQRSANFFMNDLRCRLANIPQLTTDGYQPYIEAVADTFGGKVHFSQLVKQYSQESKNKDGKIDKRERYTGAEKRIISGKPDLKSSTTSHIERQNLNVRMGVRRFTRESSGFSKKYDNHCYMLALYYVYYNFVRIHSSLRVTPAMEAKVTKRLMKIEDIAKLVDKFPFPK
jgi:IS1 family transposase